MKLTNPVAQAFIEQIDRLIERVEYLKQHPDQEAEAALIEDIQTLLQAIPETLLNGEAQFLH